MTFAYKTQTIEPTVCALTVGKNVPTVPCVMPVFMGFGTSGWHSFASMRVCVCFCLKVIGNVCEMCSTFGSFVNKFELLLPKLNTFY